MYINKYIYSLIASFPGSTLSFPLLVKESDEAWCKPGDKANSLLDHPLYLCMISSTFCRVYVNRSVSMDRIKYVGFDMDHTLVGTS